MSSWLSLIVAIFCTLSCRASSSKTSEEANRAAQVPLPPAEATLLFVDSNSIAVAFQDMSRSDGKVWAIDLAEGQESWTQGSVLWRSSRYNRFSVRLSTGGGSTSLLWAVDKLKRKLIAYALKEGSELASIEEITNAFDRETISASDFEKLATLEKTNLPARKEVHCTDVNPVGRSNAFLIEQMTMIDDHGTKKLSSIKVGRGDMTENGDGTANEYLFTSEDSFSPDIGLRASSAQWRMALPFLLRKPGEGATTGFVLHIHPQFFAPTHNEDFVVRLQSVSTPTTDLRLECSVL